jgi:hypothetical protein
VSELVGTSYTENTSLLFSKTKNRPPWHNLGCCPRRAMGMRNASRSVASQAVGGEAADDHRPQGDISTLGTPHELQHLAARSRPLACLGSIRPSQPDRPACAWPFRVGLPRQGTEEPRTRMFRKRSVRYAADYRALARLALKPGTASRHPTPFRSAVGRTSLRQPELGKVMAVYSRCEAAVSAAPGVR